MAMGDIDNDNHADIITVNSDQDTFTVHYYNPTTMEYEPNRSIPVD